jgi:predicted nucleic-acid-binding protein
MKLDACQLDTSMVLRLLVGEPTSLAKRAGDFLSSRLAAEAAVHVCDLVLAEAYFALQHYYGMPKAESLTALAIFTQHSGITFTPTAKAVLALPQLASAKPGFVDLLIHGAGQLESRTLITFEKAAKKLAGTVVL